MEIVDRHDTNTYRAVYTVQFSGTIYVLHAFQKKSKKGIATPPKDIDLIRQRLAAAERHYNERQNGAWGKTREFGRTRGAAMSLPISTCRMPSRSCCRRA